MGEVPGPGVMPVGQLGGGAAFSGGDSSQPNTRQLMSKTIVIRNMKHLD